MEPACCKIVVDRFDFLSAGIPMAEFGETKIVSSPRLSRTGPVWPVRMLSPGLTLDPSVSLVDAPSADVIVASPEALLTSQAPSPAFAPHAVQTTTKQASRARAKTFPTDMMAS